MNGPAAWKEAAVQTAMLVAWLVTTLGGLVLAARYWRSGAAADAIDRARDRQVGRIPGGRPEHHASLITPALIGAHATAALTGLALLVIWMATEDEDGWEHGGAGTLAVVLAATGLGAVMYVSWRQPENRDSRAVTSMTGGMVTVHGLAAVATIVLVAAAMVTGF